MNITPRKIAIGITLLVVAIVIVAIAVLVPGAAPAIIVGVGILAAIVAEEAIKYFIDKLWTAAAKEKEDKKEQPEEEHHHTNVKDEVQIPGLYFSHTVTTDCKDKPNSGLSPLSVNKHPRLLC